jgi:hypothetical protein
LFCRLADWRALGLGRRGHAAGPVQASILKKCQDGHLRPACWYPLRSGSLRSPPRSGYQHAASGTARMSEMCNPCVCLKCYPCVCPLPPLIPLPMEWGEGETEEHRASAFIWLFSFATRVGSG